ncbi:twin-arginine translocase subunit TatC [Ureibacillus endophyticus]|uniref:Sec-independent protein translocase protein TatC n=1 Tax=Ureibacillus endophyticus TaxID=1978490 RepID=A0A494YY48_9BACL|nr:twin-arginine translocase subunit TatC [Lysinibacillus endophyticus]RKQ15142.1 twin-arginine translocase subunit TatC [Lysinibacillus endophyticus]
MENQTMNVIEHLGELRKRIISVLIFFTVFLIVSFFFVEDIYAFLIKDIEQPLAVLSPTDIIWIYFCIASVAALGITTPFFFYHVWKYVSPGLTEEERKSSVMFIPSFFILFFLGITFGFYIIFPTVLQFLLGMVNSMFEAVFTVDKYFKFLFMLTVPLGIIFELPAIVTFLTKIKILTPDILTKYRKGAYMILVIVSVIITPPDFISDILVIVPLFILYEISIILSKYTYRKVRNEVEVLN